MKSRGQAAILDMVDAEPLHSQDEVRRRLRKAGFEATQATISRDISELGLVKRAADGAYSREGAESGATPTSLAALERTAGDYLRTVTHVQQLVVVRTGGG